jgi:Phage tail assembly chaperone protein
MNIVYINVTPNGQIVGSGTTQAGLEEYVQKIEGSEIIFGVHAEAGSNNYYDSNTKNIIAMPTKPSNDYKFDYTTKQWIYDLQSVTLKALKKRDQLLADGPDRINPVWWSSMTTEEQQAWIDYRQALLDITEQLNYPQEIIWPTKP